MSQCSGDGASDLREDLLEMRCGAVYSDASSSLSQWVSASKTLIFLPFHLILAERTCHLPSFSLL